MSKLLISNRIKFYKTGEQSKFILNTQKVLNLDAKTLSLKLGISSRTLRDWTTEKINMSQVAAEKMSVLSGVGVPKNISVIDWRLHMQKAGKIGGRNKFLKYGNISGNEEYRKNQWQKWWDGTGKYKESPLNFKSLLKIKIPKKDTKLAEFVGIMLGDGGISSYAVAITFSSEEKEYINYVSELILDLFKVKPKVYKRKGMDAVDIVIHRKQVVDFCVSLGLVVGNKVKQEVDIPDWILSNTKYLSVCLKGLFDTDGCVFVHEYLAFGKRYFYLKIAFTNASKPLVFSVHQSLGQLGISSRVSKNLKDVRIEDQAQVSKYISLIGFSNYKHLEKIKKWKNNKNVIK